MLCVTQVCLIFLTRKHYRNLRLGSFFDDIYRHLTWLAGPALAGFSVAAFGYFPVLLVDAGTYFVCAAFLVTIPSSLHTWRAWSATCQKSSWRRTLSVVGSPPMVLAIMILCGFAYTPYDPLYKTIIQQTVPLKLQAKVTSLIRPITGLGTPSGSYVSGLLVAPIGIFGLLMVSGVATVCTGFTAYLMPLVRSCRGR